MEIGMKNGSKKRRAWTSAQVRELKMLARKKTPARRIAKSLKRTEGATRQKAFSIGFRSIRAIDQRKALVRAR